MKLTPRQANLAERLSMTITVTVQTHLDISG